MLSLRTKTKAATKGGDRIPVLLGVELWVLCQRRLVLADDHHPRQLLGACDPHRGRPGQGPLGLLGPLAWGNPSLWPAGAGKSVKAQSPRHVAGCTPRHHSLSSAPLGTGQKPTL